MVIRPDSDPLHPTEPRYGTMNHSSSLQLLWFVFIMMLKVIINWVPVGLGRIIALYYHLSTLYQIHSNNNVIFGTSVSEATMRPNPRSPSPRTAGLSST
jgi:hypothetical protein